MASPTKVGRYGGHVVADEEMEFDDSITHQLSENIGKNQCQEVHEDPLDADDVPSHDIAHSCVGRYGGFIP